ncbi:MAG TPA: LPS assembly lipoprotein LptE [Verrucomicrobiales bacterium]|jgi:hypothetical protein|nr:LPS assembly lipoprotein LptE [Verrucomicrobiales bacterium]
MPPSVVLRAFTAAAALFTASCAGYRLGVDQPAVMEGIRTVAVPVFRNDSAIPRSSVLITNRVVRQFQVDGRYRIVDLAQADAVIRGTIRPVRRTQLRSEKLNTLRTLEQEVRLVLDYSVETRSGAVLTTGTVEGSTSTYLDVNYQRSDYQALDEAAARLAEDLVSRLSEGWGSADLPPPPAAPPPSSRTSSRLPF